MDTLQGQGLSMKSFYSCPVFDVCIFRMQSQEDGCKQISHGYCSKYIDVVKQIKKIGEEENERKK